MSNTSTSAMIPEASDCAPSQEAIQSAKKLHDDISQRFPIFAELFEAWWSVWHRVCEAKISQDTDKVDPCQASNEYSVLMALGPRIVPMVVYEMATYPNKYSHGVYLYRDLEKDSSYQIDVPGEVSKEKLRQLACQIVQLNYVRMKVFTKRLHHWYARQMSMPILASSSSKTRTECLEYDDILDLGTSIIAPLMVEYYDGNCGWHFELLHEIIFGHKTQGMEFFMDILYLHWESWFNNKAHENAPKYTFSERERRILRLGPGERPEDEVPKYERGNPRWEADTWHPVNLDNTGLHETSKL